MNSKIEKVEHDNFETWCKGEEKAFILINRPSGILEQVNVYLEESANKEFSPYAVGCWRIKQDNLK